MAMHFPGSWMGTDVPQPLMDWLHTIGLSDPELYLMTFKDNDYLNSWDDAMEAASAATGESQATVSGWLFNLIDRAEGKKCILAVASKHVSDVDLTVAGL